MKQLLCRWKVKTFRIKKQEHGGVISFAVVLIRHDGSEEPSIRFPTLAEAEANAALFCTTRMRR